MTPPPVPAAATPPPPAVLVVTPVPTPEADAGEADERDVLAPWVYYFPTKWVPDAAEWRESFRWQDPLPTIEPPLNWEHDTWRTPFPTFEGYRDRLFIRAYGYTYAELTPQHEADMRAIFRTHHELLPAWMKAAETLDSSEVSAFLAHNALIGINQLTDILRSEGVGVQASPHAHEIIVMTIFGDRAEVLQVYRSMDATYHDLIEEPRLRTASSRTQPSCGSRGAPRVVFRAWPRRSITATGQDAVGGTPLVSRVDNPHGRWLEHGRACSPIWVAPVTNCGSARSPRRARRPSLARRT